MYIRIFTFAIEILNILRVDILRVGVEYIQPLLFKGKNLTMEENKYPIPVRLNAILTLTVFFWSIAILITASKLPLLYSFPIGIGYSFLLLTSYALLHEATHLNLHADPKWNRVYGVLAGLLFPTSFSMVKITHIKHHCCNRTDHEMFDCYYENQFKYIQILRWYLVLLGGFWFMVPVGPILLSLYPNVINLKLVKEIKSSNIMFEDMKPKDVRHIREETILGILFWCFLFFVVGLHWEQTLVLYLCFAFNWSTRQYITHAFTKRDVVEGAHNLKASLLFEKILLNGNWDYEHHLKPALPWIYLKEEGLQNKVIKPIDYFWQYLRLWTGPRLNTDTPPLPLPRVEYVETYER